MPFATTVQRGSENQDYFDPAKARDREDAYVAAERASREKIASLPFQGGPNEFNVAGRNSVSMQQIPGLNERGMGLQSFWRQQEQKQANEPAMASLKWQQDKFGQLFPWLQGQLGNLSTQFAQIGGQSGPGPTINAAPIWNPQQIQQQVNATRAQNDQAAASQGVRQANQAAASGFGSHSPLLAALMGQTQAANLATNTGAEQQLRTTAAQQNAQQVLQAQQAREQQFSSRQKEDIERRKPYLNAYTSLLGTIAGL